jgi:hypothetical protein
MSAEDLTPPPSLRLAVFTPRKPAATDHECKPAATDHEREALRVFRLMSPEGQAVFIAAMKHLLREHPEKIAARTTVRVFFMEVERLCSGPHRSPYWNSVRGGFLDLEHEPFASLAAVKARALELLGDRDGDQPVEFVVEERHPGVYPYVRRGRYQVRVVLHGIDAAAWAAR